MTNQELNRLFWEASVSRIVKEIELFSAGWRSNGPSEHVKNQIVARIRRMPVPQAREARL